MTKKKVAVGMSGGVDSSVAAFLLKQQGYDVIGLFIKSWEEKDGSCSAAEDFEDVIKVCQTIDIPYYSFNFVKEYQDLVFSDFLKEYKKGKTPNPDILCNKEIKFKLFLQKALNLDVDFIATGHYCRKDENNRLLKAKDLSKDQSYFLYTLNTSILKKVLFPIGDLLKQDVRKIAKNNNLCTYDKKDSTGICFIGKRKFTNFLHNYIPYSAGNFETLAGKIVGKHLGLPFYTIGQRKGIKIGGQGEAWYVVGKDMKRNVVLVEQGENNKALFKDNLTASDITFIENNTKKFPMHCSAKIRYRQADQQCTIQQCHNNTAHITFSAPQRAVTEGQSIVFYDNDICMGGGIINLSQ
jgi:tRNA-uridine 2-sulfurtransferase